MADPDLLREARERYAAGIDADRLNRLRDQEDRKFYTGGDSQWTVDGKNIAASRRMEGRPAESFNRLPQFVKQVSGELRQNKPAIKVLPVDGQTDPALADVYSAIIMNIENQSGAHRIYAKTGEQAAIGGQGWWRIKADYCGDDGFDQELLIDRIPNPLAVVCDPAARAPTRIDMKWAFVTEMKPRDDFADEYPDINASDFDNSDETFREWVDGDFVRIAEYWRKRPTGTKRLFALRSLEGQTVIANEDDLKQQGLKKITPQALAEQGLEIVSQRSVETFVVESIMICGAGELGDWKPWPGKYIPLVRVVGEEVEAGDTVFRYGMVHHARAPQVGYNYARNAMIERHGQSTRSPYLATVKQIQNYKGMWETANTKNHAVLIYDADPASPGPPIRTPPPQLDAAAYQESMIASEDMQATTGIYNSSLGAKSNETSGVAIAKRDAQGNTATFVYIDNLEEAIESTGRMLIDLIEFYYSDERVIRIIGEDDEVQGFQTINQQLPDGRTWNDVTTGKYDLVVTTGPSDSTRRQEAADRLMQLTQIPEVAQFGADILVRSLDIPMGDKLADRLKRALPPGIDPQVDQERAQQQQGQQPSPQQQQMAAEQQQAQQKMQMEAQLEQQRMQANADKHSAALQQQSQLAMVKAHLDQQARAQQGQLDAHMQQQQAMLSATLEHWKAELQARTQIEVAEIAAAATLNAQQISAANQGVAPTGA